MSIHTHTHIHRQVRAHAHAHAHTHIHRQACMHVHARTHTHTHTHLSCFPVVVFFVVASSYIITTLNRSELDTNRHHNASLLSVLLATYIGDTDTVKQSHVYAYTHTHTNKHIHARTHNICKC